MAPGWEKAGRRGAACGATVLHCVWQGAGGSCGDLGACTWMQDHITDEKLWSQCKASNASRHVEQGSPARASHGLGEAGDTLLGAGGAPWLSLSCVVPPSTQGEGGSRWCEAAAPVCHKKGAGADPRWRLGGFHRPLGRRKTDGTGWLGWQPMGHASPGLHRPWWLRGAMLLPGVPVLSPSASVTRAIPAAGSTSLLPTLTWHGGRPQPLPVAQRQAPSRTGTARALPEPSTPQSGLGNAPGTGSPCEGVPGASRGRVPNPPRARGKSWRGERAGPLRRPEPTLGEVRSC